MINKYSELYKVAVRSLFYRAQKYVCQVCSLDNTLLYKLSYTPSLLQILHVLIPSDTWHHRWTTQFITYIRRQIISARTPNSYNCLHKMLT